MLRRIGHHQAKREQGRNAERVGPLAERCLRGGDIWLCADSPRNA